MTLIKLAWRNLLRSRRKTALMIAIVAFGTWAIVVMWGLTEGFFTSMIHAQTSLDTGDLQIHRSGYLEDPDLELTIDLEVLQALPKARPRIEFEGLLRSAYSAVGVWGRGIEPKLEVEATKVNETMIEGRFLEGPGEIILSRKLAERLDVRIGERIVFLAHGLKGPKTKAFRLVGLFSSGLPTLDQGFAFIHFQDAQALTGAKGATEIALNLPQGVDLKRVAKTLQRELGDDYNVSTYMGLNPLLTALMRAQRIEMMPTMLLLAILAGFGVANTVLFTVLERTREFGVLISLGLKPRRLAGLVLLESVFASIGGFLIGGGLGWVLVAIFARTGINFAGYAKAMPDLGIPHIIYTETSGWYWLYSFSVVVMTALIAAWYPARRAASLEPAEAMQRT